MISKVIRKKKNDVIRRPRQRMQKKTEASAKNRWIFYGVACVFFIGCGYVLLCAHVVDIVSVRVQNTQRVDARDVELAAQGLLEGNITYCIKKNNFFFVNTRDIADRIKEDQRIRDVQVKKIFPQSIEIVVQEYDELPIWCLEKSGTCHILKDGCVERDVELSSDLAQKNPHFVVIDHAHDQLESGQCVISAADLSMIGFLGKELIYAMDVRITEPYHVDLRGSREVKYYTDEGWYVMIDVTRSAEDIVTTAKLFMKQVVQSDQRSQIEYADLRFPEKIFYKMKNEQQQEDDGDEKEDQKADEKKLDKKEDDIGTVTHD